MQLSVSERASLRSLDVAEPCPEHLHVRIYFECDIADLGPDMFAFSITIGPDEEDGGISCLCLDVARHDLLVLVQVR